MKTWTPDTCPAPGCIIEEIYDGSTIVGPGQIIRKCVAHQAIADADLYGVLYANPNSENKRKNLIFRTLCGFDGLNLGADNGAGQLKNGIEYVWSFSGVGSDRVLTIQITGIVLTAQKKTTFQNFLNTKFGVGRVILL